MDGKEALFGTVCGNSREVLNTIRVDLPKKHGESILFTTNIHVSCSFYVYHVIVSVVEEVLCSLLYYCVSLVG